MGVKHFVRKEAEVLPGLDVVSVQLPSPLKIPEEAKAESVGLVFATLLLMLSRIVMDDKH